MSLPVTCGTTLIRRFSDIVAVLEFDPEIEDGGVEAACDTLTVVRLPRTRPHGPLNESAARAGKRIWTVLERREDLGHPPQSEVRTCELV